MTSLKHLVIAFLLLGLGFAGTAQAAAPASLSLALGSGAQLHIGDGLALPVAQAATSAVTGMVFPPLLIPKKAGLQTVMQTTLSTMVTGRKITIPPGVLFKKADQRTVGINADNTTLFAVGTNLTYSWPAPGGLTTPSAVFSTAKRTGGMPFTFVGADTTQKATYSFRTGTKRFGGAARFDLSPGSTAATSGVKPGAVTLYAIAGAPGFAPCGPCAAGIITNKPTGNGAH